MVLKGKGGKKCRSVKSGKNSKSSLKYNKKTNYKKNKIYEKGECVICYEEVKKANDNTIQCGQSIHTLCMGCKWKLINDLNGDCPMCRSHKVLQPKESCGLLQIYSKGTRFGKELTYQDFIDVFSEEELNRARFLTK